MADASFVKRGTLYGTLTVTFISITSGELMKTAILAAAGAMTSMLVSMFIKWLIQKVIRKKDH